MVTHIQIEWCSPLIVGYGSHARIHIIYNTHSLQKEMVSINSVFLWEVNQMRNDSNRFHSILSVFLFCMCVQFFPSFLVLSGLPSRKMYAFFTCSTLYTSIRYDIRFNIIRYRWLSVLGPVFFYSHVPCRLCWLHIIHQHDTYDMLATHTYKSSRYQN